MPRPSRAAQFEPHTATCPVCGSDFWKDEPWKGVCFPCYRAANPERYPVPERPRTATQQRIVAEAGLRQQNEKLLTEVLTLRRQVQYLRLLLEARPEPEVFDAAMLDRLIRLCHPDRHNGSDASTKATQYLLGLRKK